MGLRSGRIIAQLLKSAFKFSGNGVRPAYPGFIVIQKPHVGMRSMIVPKKSNLPTLFGGVPADRCWYCSSLREGTAYFTMASWTVLTCVATTDSTSDTKRLNSSKQPQAPVVRLEDVGHGLVVHLVAAVEHVTRQVELLRNL